MVKKKVDRILTQLRKESRSVPLVKRETVTKPVLVAVERQASPLDETGIVTVTGDEDRNDTLRSLRFDGEFWVSPE